MTRVTVSAGKLVVEMLGWDKFWAFRSRVEVPLAQVSGVRAAAAERPEGLRLLGTHIPRLITAGIFVQGSQKVFWAVHDVQKAVAIDLHDASFSRLVVQVIDPSAIVNSLQATLASAGLQQDTPQDGASPPSSRSPDAAHSRVRKSSRASMLLFTGLALLYVFFLARSFPHWPRLPATHFDVSGQANGWMTRSSLLLVSVVFGVGFPLLVCWLARSVYSRWWFACLTLGFAIGLQYLVLRANETSPPHLSTTAVLLLAGAFLAGTAVWIVTLLRSPNPAA